VWVSRTNAVRSEAPAAAAGSTAGSGTRRSSGIENSAHHTATLMKVARVAAPASGKPNHAGR
jgi:hypothetical protein